MLKYMLKYISIFYAKSELIESLYKLAAKHCYSDYFIRIQYHIYKVHCSNDNDKLICNCSSV